MTHTVARPTVIIFINHISIKLFLVYFSFHSNFIVSNSNDAFIAPPITGTKNQETGLNVPQLNIHITRFPKVSSHTIPDKGRRIRPINPEVKLAARQYRIDFVALCLKIQRIPKYSKTRLNKIIGIVLTFVSA